MQQRTKFFIDLATIKCKANLPRATKIVKHIKKISVIHGVRNIDFDNGYVRRAFGVLELINGHFPGMLAAVLLLQPVLSSRVMTSGTMVRISQLGFRT